MSPQPLLRKVTDVSMIADAYSSMFGKELGFVFVGGQPVSMMEESLMHVVQKFPGSDEFCYNVTPKLDGERMLLMILTNKKYIGRYRFVFLNRSMECMESDDVFLNSVDEDDEWFSLCLLDGEYFCPVYFAFDVIYLYGVQNVFLSCFELRIRFLNEFLKSNCGLINQLYTRSHIAVVLKEYYDLNTVSSDNNDNAADDDTVLYTILKRRFVETYIERLNMADILPDHQFRFDGLIFTPRSTRYVIGANWKLPGNILYKFKPKCQETIDFSISQNVGIGEITDALVVTATNVLKPFLVKPYGRIVILNIDIKKEDVRLLNAELLKGSVYECCYYSACSTDEVATFVPVRLRSDKLVANSFKTATACFKLLTRSWKIDSILPLLCRCGNVSSLPFLRWQVQLLRGEIVPFDSNDHIVCRYNRQRSESRYPIEFEIRVRAVQFRHFSWLMRSLDSKGISKTYSETVDVFAEKGMRITVLKDDGTLVSCIKKSVLDRKDYTQFYETFGYSFRVSVAHEQPEPLHQFRQQIVMSDLSFPRRTKSRWSYHYSSSWNIDMTECVDSRGLGKQFQVELEHVGDTDIEIHELNTVLVMMLADLYGNSEIL